jgi:hypothetical protein
MTFFPLRENWLRVVEISLHHEKEHRSTLADKMEEESDRNGI